MRALGWLVAGSVAVAVGLAMALAVLTGTVGPECPSYDDEGETAAPGSPYSAVLCGTLDSVPSFLGALTVLVVVAVLVAALLVGLLQRRLPHAGAWGLLALAATPPLLVLALHHVLPEDCLGGPDDSNACQRDRELL